MDWAHSWLLIFYMVVHYVYGHGLYWQLAKGIHLSRYNRRFQISFRILNPSGFHLHIPT